MQWFIIKELSIQILITCSPALFTCIISLSKTWRFIVNGWNCSIRNTAKIAKHQENTSSLPSSASSSSSSSSPLSSHCPHDHNHMQSKLPTCIPLLFMLFKLSYIICFMSVLFYFGFDMGFFQASHMIIERDPHTQEKNWTHILQGTLLAHGIFFSRWGLVKYHVYPENAKLYFRWYWCVPKDGYIKVPLKSPVAWHNCHCNFGILTRGELVQWKHMLKRLVSKTQCNCIPFISTFLW